MFQSLMIENYVPLIIRFHILVYQLIIFSSGGIMSLFKTIKDKKNAKKFNIKYSEYTEYLFVYEKYGTDIDKFIKFLKEVTSKQYIDYTNNFKEMYSIEKYKLYLECIELGISQENSIQYLDKFISVYEPERYLKYLEAVELNLTIDQYEEWKDKHRDTMSASRYLDLIEASKHQISLMEYDEWMMDYRESMTLDRFKDLIGARSKNMTIEEYDESIAAEKLGMTLLEYRTFQIAKSLNLTLEEYDHYVRIKSSEKSRESKFLVRDISEIKALNKLGYQNIILNNTIECIPDGAFLDCDSFTQVFLPCGLKTIGVNAFKNCSNLKSISFPGSLREIPQNVLSGCTSLTSIHLHHGIKEVDISGWLDLPNLLEVASTASIKSFSIENEKGIRHRIANDYSGSKLNRVKNNVEILEIDSMEFIKDFPNLRILIIDSFQQTQYIQNCPNLEMIITGDFKDHYYQVTKNRLVAPKLKFFLISDFADSVERSLSLTNFEALIWLHVPSDTRKISLSSSPNLNIIGVDNYRVLPQSVSNGFIYKLDALEIDPYSYEKCKDGRSYIFSSRFSNFDLGCKRLVISEGTTQVREKAFQESRMTEVVFPFSLQEIQGEAFADCSELKRITFANTPHEISLNAFAGSENIRETNIENKFDFRNKYKMMNLDISDVKSLSLEGEVIIPQFYAYASGIKKIVIPDTVQVINSKAFAHCSSLEKIIFESNLDEIASDAFENCDNVKEIQWRGSQIYKIDGNSGFSKVKKMIIPEGVTEINSRMFKKWGLESIVLPTTLRTVADEAFAGCKNLRIINQGKENTITINNSYKITKTSFKGCTELNEIVYDCDEITNESLSLIQQCRATSIWIRDDIKIDSYVQLMNEKIKYIRCMETLNSVPIIGSENLKLEYPPKLKVLELPQIIQVLSITDLSDSKSSLTELKLSENTVLNDPDFFDFFHNIKEVSMHVDTYNLFGKENISKKINVRLFGEEHKFIDVFDYSLETLKIPEKMTYKEKQYITKITINKDITEIVANAFRNFTNLKSIEIKGNINVIGEGAFANCRQLEKILLPQGLIEIGGSAFENCINLKGIELPNSVVRIGAGAFKNCIGLDKVIVPPQISELSKETFMNCSNLRIIQGMVNIKNVEENVFKNCNALKDVVFSPAIKSIHNAFEGCRSLERIVIPNDLDKFAVKLGTCTALKKLYLPKMIDEMSFRSYERGLRDSNSNKDTVESSHSPVKIYAKRGSKWKSKVGSVDVIYLNKKEYEDILESAFMESGIFTFQVDSVESNYTSERRKSIKPDGIKTGTIERPQQRASWKTRSIQNSVADPFPQHILNVASIVDSLKTNGSPMYKCTKHELSMNEIFPDEIKVINSDTISGPKMITNRIFTVRFDAEVIQNGNPVYVSIATQKGELISTVMKVELLDKNYKGQIDVQLELTSEPNDLEFLIVIGSICRREVTIVASKSTIVNISFTMDMDFGF